MTGRTSPGGADRLANVGLSRTFQIARGLAQLTVIENLMLYGKHQPGETFCAAVLRTRAARAREEELRQRAIVVARELNLLQVADNRAIDLSGRQKKLLELGRALMAEPKLIMLDEPAAGINPTLAKKLGDHILALKARGITFLIIEHNMGLVRRCATTWWCWCRASRSPKAASRTCAPTRACRKPTWASA